jgi:Ca2+-binding RTX toxin-like protein
VVKSLSPATDPGRFNLQVDGTTQAANAGNGASTGAISVNTGNHTVGETAGTNANLDDYDKSISCDDGTSSTGDVSSLQVNVADGENVVCTITNTRETGSITVTKSLNPTHDPGRFNLQIDGTTQAAEAGDGGTTGAIQVNTGNHTVGETAGSVTDLADYQKSIDCGDGGEATTGDSGGPLTVNVSDGEDVVCTITNVRETIELPALPPPDKRFCSVEEPTIRGTNGPDKIVGTPGNDVIKSRGGDDVINGKGGHDLICPNKGNDKATGGSGNDTVRGGPDEDKLKGSGGNDFVHGYSGDDIVNGGKGTDGCRGGTGVTIRISCEGRVPATT